MILHCKVFIETIWPGQWQPGLMRWILIWIMPQVQDRLLDLLTCNPARYHCTTYNGPSFITIMSLWYTWIPSYPPCYLFQTPQIFSMLNCFYQPRFMFQTSQIERFLSTQMHVSDVTDFRPVVGLCDLPCTGWWSGLATSNSTVPVSMSRSLKRVKSML